MRPYKYLQEVEVKLTYGQIYMAMEPRGNSPLDRLRGKELPIGLAIRLRRISNQISQSYSEIIDTRNDLVEKLGEDDQVKAGTAAMEQFNQEFAKALNVEIEVDIDTVNVNELSNITISVQDLDSLFFIVDPTPEQEEEEE
jgi:hypothetical protein